MLMGWFFFFFLLPISFLLPRHEIIGQTAIRVSGGINRKNSYSGVPLEGRRRFLFFSSPHAYLFYPTGRISIRRSYCGFFFFLILYRNNIPEHMAGGSARRDVGHNGFSACSRISWFFFLFRFLADIKTKNKQTKSSWNCFALQWEIY